MRAWSSLAPARVAPVLVLCVVPSMVLAGPSAHGSSDAPVSAAATVVIDLVPAPGTPPWLASAFEQSITRELSGFERFTAVAKEDVGVQGCGSDTSCRLRGYRKAAIDIVLFGQVRDDAITYELYQTWTPARLATGSIETGRGQTAIGLKHATRDAFHPVLKHGGLLDQRGLSFERTTATQAARPSGWSERALAIVPGLVLVLLLPFALLAVRIRALRVIIAMRTARRAATVALVGAFSVVTFDERSLAELVESWPWIFAGLGGLAWGAFLVVGVRAIFPPHDGLERVAPQDLLRILMTWWLACGERLLLLLALYVPLGWCVARLGSALAIPDLWTLVLLGPGVAFAARLWLASWVECLAVVLDRRLVDGAATSENPWSREIASYLIGYVRRTGWDLEPELLASVVFLPGKARDGVISYGGGATHTRIVVDKGLLELTMGPLVEIKPEEKPALWPDWTTATVVPQPGARMRQATISSDDFRGRKRKTSYPGIQRKPLGQPATLLGHVIPAPGQLVPLISDNPQDLAVVRELLSEHYPWFAPDPDDEYDATDPTDKDFLFGALVRELGIVRRQETQLATVKLMLGARIAHFTSRYRSRIADSYAALNFARHHLIQYLHYRWSGEPDHLTARGRSERLLETTKQILLQVAPEPAKQHAKPQDDDARRAERPRSLRSRLVWLSRFFPEPIVDRRDAKLRKLTAAAVIAAVLVAVGIMTKQSINYHAIYAQRIEAQERELAKSKQDGERNPGKGSHVEAKEK